MNYITISVGGIRIPGYNVLMSVNSVGRLNYVCVGKCSTFNTVNVSSTHDALSKKVLHRLFGFGSGTLCGAHKILYSVA